MSDDVTRRLMLYRIVARGFVAGFLADERGEVVEKCATCGGAGNIRAPESDYGMLEAFAQCPTCKGAGRIPAAANDTPRAAVALIDVVTP